jgi:hypothetical protein
MKGENLLNQDSILRPHADKSSTQSQSERALYRMVTDLFYLKKNIKNTCYLGLYIGRLTRR